MPVTTEQLVEALRPVEDPELHRSIVELGMVRRAELRADGVASVLVALTVAGCPLRNEITSRVDAALLALDEVTAVDNVPGPLVLSASGEQAPGLLASRFATDELAALDCPVPLPEQWFTAAGGGASASRARARSRRRTRGHPGPRGG